MKKTDHEIVRFKLVNDALDPGREFGEVSFNGRFTFELAQDIDTTVWQRVGIIPLEDGKRCVEVADLFMYLNSRLPLELRNASSHAKLDYIKANGLRVASDNFRLVTV
ncbi:MAG: hypothetical protein ACREGF_00580 [Candidatus Saccharimonadales bacterium]